MSPLDILARMSLEELRLLREEVNIFWRFDPVFKGALRLIDEEIRRARANRKLASLAKTVPMLGNAEKEPAMHTKTIWYGAKDNNVRFADNQAALASQGIDNPKSFSVSGDVTGLDLNTNEQQPGATASSPQTA